MAFKMKGSAFKLGNVATKSALKQKLSMWEKLGAAKDAIAGVHPESGLGSLYDMYKRGKKSRREEKRKSEMNKKD
tara:strand:+ start:130 stop:354 length:225 start_codon:yes stop_codon:yes gene_type:complete